MRITEKEAIRIGKEWAEEKGLIFDYVHRFPGDDNSPAMYVVNCVTNDGEQRIAGFDGICKAILEDDGSVIDFHMPVPQ